MAISKNFVVRHGLEVNTNLILADANTNKVGIGSTAPRFELDVAGGIGATNFYLSGIGTVLNELNVGTDGSVLTVLGVGGSVGVGTALPRYLLDIRSPVSTGQTALYVQGDVKITGDLSVDDITFDDASVSNLTITEALNVTSPGISTFGGYVDINSSADISGTLNVTGISTLGGYVDINNSVDLGGSLNVTGVTTTNGLNVIGHGEFDDINVSGVATISQLDVQSDFDVYAPSTFYNNVTIDGNLIVNGTETIINTQTLFVNDKDIVLGIGTTPGNETDASANHGGIAVASTEGSPLISLVAAGINTFPDTYKQIMWVAGETFGVGTTDAWLFNYAVGVGSTQVPNGVRFAASAIQFTDDTINTPNINVSDTSILDGVKIATGIVTASSGIVTYYGDGSKLSNVISGVGIKTAGGTVGTAATILDFRGAGISTVTVSAGIATINITGGSEIADGSVTPAKLSTGGPSWNTSGDVYISGVSTFGVTTTTNLTSQQLNVSGVSTLGVTTTTNLTSQQLNVSGVSTFGVTTTTNLTSQQLNVSGVSTFAGITTVTGTTLFAKQLNVSGISTLGTIQVSSGIVTASSGIVTYYGDGSKLSNVISGVGIRTSGGLVGTGATTLDFRGSGISTVTVSAGIATINVSGGGGGFSVTDDTSTNSTYYPVYVNSTSGSPSQISVSSTKLNFNPSSGNFSATQFTSLSDATKKTNIKTIENPIEITKQLDGVRFDWIDNNKPSLGLIAQEVEKVLPELVETNSDGTKSVSYGNIVGVLIEAIKEQQVRIEELERKLNV